jgi:hypothetical protein
VLTQNQEKYQEVLEVAETLHRQSPDWVTFFREVLGVEGVVRKAFPTFDELTAFEQSPQFDKIQKLLVRLREKRSNVDVETEPTRVITVRLPKSMHPERADRNQLAGAAAVAGDDPGHDRDGNDGVQSDRAGHDGSGGFDVRPGLSAPVAAAVQAGAGADLGLRQHFVFIERAALARGRLFRCARRMWYNRRRSSHGVWAS